LSQAIRAPHSYIDPQDAMSLATSLLFRKLPRAIWHATAWRDLEIVEDVRYGEHPDHRVDVLRTRGEPAVRPIVFHVHGGGFRILSKETHGGVAARYARAGFLVFNVDYRLAPANPYPAAVSDVHQAYLWLLENAASFGGDPDRLVLAGESAGANLILGLTLSTVTRRSEPWATPVFDAGVVPRAIQPICGFLQSTDTARYGRELPIGAIARQRMDVIERHYFAGRSPDVPLDYADPLVMLEALSEPVRPFPPTLAPCGTTDPVADDTRRLATQLERLGAGRALWVEGAVHGFHALPLPGAEIAWDALLAHARETTVHSHSIVPGGLEEIS
jgi:acetyl esterase